LALVELKEPPMVKATPVQAQPLQPLRETVAVAVAALMLVLLERLVVVVLVLVVYEQVEQVSPERDMQVVAVIPMKQLTAQLVAVVEPVQ
jgi:hypothetical protein